MCSVPADLPDMGSVFLPKEKATNLLAAFL
jgi:hypothetical protein